MKRDRRMNAEQQRLEEQRTGTGDWRLWGTYLSERAWGTVREDYSPHGEAWEPALSILHLIRNPEIGGLHANNTHSAFSKVNPARKC